MTAPGVAEEDLQLVEAAIEYQEQFADLAREYAALGDPREKARHEEAMKDIPGHIQRLQEMPRGENLPEGIVPATTYWLVRGGRTIVATGNLRHRLTPRLEHEGGHIGYGTRPSERRKGYGTILCRLVLQKAREMGLKRVLITCDTDNVASAKIIRKNGGRLENQVVSTETGKLKDRYWVEL